MSNFPTLSADATTLIIYINAFQYQGRGPRLKPSKARNELKKHGLIESRPINANVLLPAAAGNGYQWTCTSFGYEIAEALRRERDEADQPPYSNPFGWSHKQPRETRDRIGI